MKKITMKKFPNRFGRAPLAAAILLLSPGLIAQQSAGIEEVVVTAQKRAQNLQDVPISIQTLGNETISDLGIQDFQDYAKMLPSVAMTPSLGAGSIVLHLFICAVSRQLEMVKRPHHSQVWACIWDEQPITTIQGNLDVHMYDVALCRGIVRTSRNSIRRQLSSRNNPYYH